MAENFYDKNLLQKVLVSISDKIEDGIVADTRLAPIPYTNIIKIAPSSTRGLGETSSKNVLMRERQLLSGLPVPSRAAALELFSNSDSPTDFQYIMSHYVFVTIPDVGPLPGGTYYFNIDQVNRELQGRVFFKRVNIKNASKDVYTLKANYVISLEIAFSFFGNLLENSITMANINDPSDTRTYAPIQLIYKYYDSTDNGLKSSEDMAVRDADGLYIVQQLNLLDSDRFSNMRSSGLDRIYKNYHVTYYKHEFDVFRDEDPLPNMLGNSLVISYMAYESDLEIKVGLSDDTPRLSDNIYSVLADARKVLATIKGGGATTSDDLDILTLSDAIDSINEIKIKLAEKENLVNCALLFKNTKDANIKSKLNAYEPNSTPEALTKLREEIAELRTKINDIVFRIDRTLITYILAKCKIYSLNIDAGLLGTFEAIERFKNVGENLGKVAMGAVEIATGVAIIPATFGVGTVAGAIAIGQGTIEVGSALVDLAIGTTTIQNQALSIDAIRGSFSAGVNIKLADSFFNKIKQIGEDMVTSTGVLGQLNQIITIDDKEDQSLDLAEKISSQGLNKGKTLTGEWSGVNLLGKNTDDNADSSRIKEGLKVALDDAYSIPLKQTGEDVEIQFVLFGDLLSTLFETSVNSYMIAGGKLILDAGAANAGGSATSSYVNIMHTPISLEAVSKFLKQKILDTPRNMFYPTDLFMKDLYEILLKNALTSTNGFKEYENFFHTNLRMLSTIHKNGGDFDKIKRRAAGGRGIDTLDDAVFPEFCKDLRTTQNLLRTTAPGAGLQKIFTIGSEEEVKYYNFYESYNSSIGPSIGKNIFTTTGEGSFQDWIIKENWIPCLALNPTLRNDSMLKSKNLKFSKIDNPNIVLGNIQGGLSLFRLPYSFTGTFKIYLSHFLDLGSLIFVAPPNTSPYNLVTNTGNLPTELVHNTFGFGGLYVITSAEFDYNFQRLTDSNNITLPNEEGKLTLGGYAISWGDGVRRAKSKANKLIERCTTGAAATASGIGGGGVRGAGGGGAIGGGGAAAGTTTATQFDPAYTQAIKNSFR